MPIDPDVVELLERIADSGLSAEEACRDRPDLLGEVRACLRQLASIRDEMDALFPNEEDAREAAASRQERPEIPGYVVGEVVGRGGMGVVYRARHLRLNRQVAVKMMLNGGFAGPRELARFQREAEALAALQHPNIIQVHDVGESRGLPYFTMEFADGGNLAQQLGGVPQPAGAAVALLRALADAVEAAHRGGIVHRDLKPSNVLLTAGGTPKITDFGLARRVDAGAALSMTGMRVGTPAYMAPEQASGQARVSGPAADVYALGAILYEVLTGRPPFLAETVAETERQLIAEEPAPPSRLNAKVPRDLETICLKCLRKEPRRRYPSAAELAADLARFRRGEPIKGRPVGRAERAAKWIRRHPARAVTMLSGSTIAAALLAGEWWLVSARSLVTHAVEGDLLVARKALRRSDWGEARAALQRARARLGPAETGDLRRQLDRAEADQDLVGRLAEIRVARISQSRLFDRCADDYRQAFRGAGLLDPADAPGVAADRLKGSDVKDALVAAVDDWAFSEGAIANYRGQGWQANARREVWLLRVATKADPDPRGWRNRLRDPSVRRNKEELAELVGSARIDETQVDLMVSLGELLQKSGGDATPFLQSIQQHHPDNLWVNYLLGFDALDRDDAPTAIRYMQAALATQPGAAFIHHNLGEALEYAGKLGEAITYHSTAVRLDPASPVLRWHFGECLTTAGRIPEAVDQFLRGLALTQDVTERASLRRGLRRCYALLGDFEKLEALWRKSVEVKPPNLEDWDSYAEFCLYRGRPDEYRAACQVLIEHFGVPTDAQAAERTGRACLLLPASGELLAKATALIDFALLEEKNSKPTWTHPYFQVAKGLAEYRLGRLESALSIMEGPASPALQPAPRLVATMALHRLGRKEAALKSFSEALRSTDWAPAQATDREKWIYHVLRREAEAMLSSGR